MVVVPLEHTVAVGIASVRCLGRHNVATVMRGRSVALRRAVKVIAVVACAVRCNTRHAVGSIDRCVVSCACRDWCFCHCKPLVVVRP